MPWDEDEDLRESWNERSHPQYKKNERRSEERYHRRRSSPYLEPERFLDLGEGPRHREAFREDARHYEDRRGEPRRDYKHDYVEREPEWRQDEPDRGSRERFRDRSPLRHNRNFRQRGRGQYRRHLLYRDTWRPDHQQNDNRREMDGSPESGCDWEEQHFSGDERKERFYRNDHEPQRFKQNRNEPMEPRRREEYSLERDAQRLRGSRSMSREETRSGHFGENSSDDGYRQKRWTPFKDDVAKFEQYKDKPPNRGRARGNFNGRGRFRHRGRGWPRGNRQQPQKVQSPSNDLPKFREEETFYDEPEAAWEPKDVDEAWDDDEDDDQQMMKSPRDDLETQQPRKQWRPSETRPNMMFVTETLTIKVDMSRPVNKNSLMLYSADRPLSLDLVHVGRQRLDFLSTENPEPNQENTVRIGSFAREIIALMHQVKDQYFGGQGIPLTERFALQQNPKYSKEEPQEMTLNKRFSANRALNVNYDSLTERKEPLFSKQGPLQLMGSPSVRDPDDLRHDLEKRRQERLEGVKVTIVGSQRPQQPSPPSPSEQTFGDEAFEEDESSDWSEELQWRPKGSTGPKRGGSFRPFRSNNRLMRRPFNRNNSRGQSW